MADDSADDALPPGASALTARTRRGRRRLRVAALTTAAALTVTAAAGVALYVKFDGNIAGLDIDSALGGDRPEDAPHGSLDILVLGSDSRAGGNGVYGSEDGARADTAMIVHINEEHDAATLVSIPRDTLVTRPACDRADGTAAPEAPRTMYNEAYEIGGPACAVKTTESLTGIRMDHYIEIDFKGFEKIIDTLGGVEITTREDLRDPDSRLDLAAGTHTLDGAQALALVRTRHAIGDGSDLGRIRLQHTFVRALAEQVGSIGLFGNPKKLYDLADAATSSLTTDSTLASVSELTGLARTLKNIGPDQLDMITLPIAHDEHDPNRVVPLSPQSERLWEALRRDEPVPEAAREGSAAEREQPGAEVTPGTPEGGE
ncbi:MULTISPECIES: LCP family protein [Streptomyces]|uniref:LCP family protein n=1 Tax=Streptomyces TaxID=1883 RepID=UPI001908476E|nr:LCP family protein [Streptomyces sp. XC 2026]QQN77224.1 LCP family protein [Streptomyces sp. XC 2026]